MSTPPQLFSFPSEMSGPIKVLDHTLSLDILESLECHQGPCECICMDPSGRYFATGGADALIVIWDLHEMIPVKTITNVERKIKNISYSHDSQYIAVTSKAHAVNIFKAEPTDNQLMDFLMQKSSKTSRVTFRRPRVRAERRSAITQEKWHEWDPDGAELREMESEEAGAGLFGR